MTQRSRRRIAAVIDAVEPWNTGGKERRHHEILTRLADNGYDVDVHTMAWWTKDGSREPYGRRPVPDDGRRPVPDDGRRPVPDDGRRPVSTGGSTVKIGNLNYHKLSAYRPLYTKSRRSISQAVLFAISTVRMIGRPFDVLEADAIPFLQLFPLRVVTWLRRKPMVVTWHEYWGTEYWVQYLGPLGHVAGLIERIAVRLPDRIIAASVATAERLERLAPAGLDICVVPNGIDVRALRELANLKPSAGAQLQLVSIGRLLDHKNVDKAVQAAAVLRDRGLDARLTIVGEGPERSAIQALIDELNLADRVELRAFLPQHSDVLSLLAVSDVLIFPSVREGFGMAALEAMAVGTPVVTSDHPDNLARHLVNDGVNGVVCPPTGVDIAQAALQVANQRDQFGAAALATAEDYDWNRLSVEAAGAYGS